MSPDKTADIKGWDDLRDILDKIPDAESVIAKSNNSRHRGCIFDTETGPLELDPHKILRYSKEQTCGPDEWTDKKAWDMMVLCVTDPDALSINKATDKIIEMAYKSAKCKSAKDNQSKCSFSNHLDFIIDQFEYLMFHLVRQLPFNHIASSRFTELFLQMVQDPRMKIHDAPKGLEDLPYLSPIWYEWNNDANGWEEEFPESSFNLTGFLARLGGSEGEYAKLAYCGGSNFRDVLEYHDRNEGVHEHNIFGLAIWMRYSGSAIFVRYAMGDNRDDIVIQGDYYGGPQYGLRRWRFWKKRLQFLQSSSKVSEKAKELIRVVLELMESVENGFTGQYAEEEEEVDDEIVPNA